MIEEEFDAACKYVGTLAAKSSLGEGDLLKFYGLYKQATEGRCLGSRPGMFNPKARRKFDAWQAVGELSTEQAQCEYVALLSQLRPDWPAEQGSRRNGGAGGPVFSRMADVDDCKDEGCSISPLHAAASAGDAEAVNRFLHEGCDPDLRDSDGCAPLHWAADRGHAHLVSLLIKHGSAVDPRDDELMTPLHYACLSEQRQVAECLVESGADFELKSSDGQTPASLAPPDWEFLKARGGNNE